MSGPYRCPGPCDRCGDICLTSANHCPTCTGPPPRAAAEHRAQTLRRISDKQRRIRAIRGLNETAENMRLTKGKPS